MALFIPPYPTFFSLLYPIRPIFFEFFPCLKSHYLAYFTQLLLLSVAYFIQFVNSFTFFTRFLLLSLANFAQLLLLSLTYMYCSSPNSPCMPSLALPYIPSHIRWPTSTNLTHFPCLSLPSILRLPYILYSWGDHIPWLFYLACCASWLTSIGSITLYPE